jgi:predicted transcriptional regulator
MTDRATFTIRLDPDLIAPLDERVKSMGVSRNWGIEQAVRDFLNRPAADDTRMNTSGDARGTSAEGFGERARRGRSKTGGTMPEYRPGPDEIPVRMEAPQATETPSPDGVGVDARVPQNTPQHPGGPHRHRFTAEVPNTRRGIRGVIYATYRCDDPDCGLTLERKAPK